MTIRLPILLAAALVAAAPAGAQTVDEVARGRAAYAEGVAAYRAGDPDAFLAAMKRADALRPAHPGILYALASARALAGDGAGAIATLERLAAMGLAYHPSADADFAALADDPGFRTAAARLRGNAAPAGIADTAFTLPWRDFVPEGIAHDPATGAFFVSGVHGRRVARVDPDGRVEPFVDGLWSALGLAVDADRRILWIGTAAMPETAGVDSTEIGRAALVAVDLGTGRRVREAPLPRDGHAHVAGDLTVAPDGTVYASDAAAGVLWALRPGTDAPVPLVGSEDLLSPQGSALAADGRTLWLADYSLGILAVDPATGAIRRIAAPPDATLLGIDALLRDGDDLVAVQNGVRPARVLRLALDSAAGVIRSWRVIVAALPEFEEPTGATLAGGRLWLVANSHWDRFDGGTLVEPATLSPPLVLSIDPAAEEMLEN